MNVLPCPIALNQRGRAGALLHRRTEEATRAGIHRPAEDELRGEGERHRRAGDRDATILQRLLAQHPGLRALKSFEAANPAPFFEKGPLGPGEEDPRVGVARMAENSIRYMAPDLGYAARSWTS